MSGFNERTVIEDYIVDNLQKKQWKFVNANSLKRRELDEPLLIDDLRRNIKKLNKDESISDEETEKVIEELRLKSSGIEGNKRILEYLKTGIPLKSDRDKILRYVRLIDHRNIVENNFVVSRQVFFKGKKDIIRVDICLYVNGIPLVVIECKNPVSYESDWSDAYNDIKEYEKMVPSLFKYVQIGIAAEHIAKFFPIVPWEEEVSIDEWHHEKTVETNSDSIDSIIEMMSPSILLDIIKNFIFMRIERGQTTKIICRYIQYRAANKIVNRVLNYLEGEKEKNKGLIWHWQGSGKTLTMIFAANKLYLHPKLENPSIFFIIDRQGLEEQLFTEFTSLDISSPEPIASVGGLRDAIRYDDYAGKRGFLITLIHKFRHNELNQLKIELTTLNNQNSFLNRKNIIAFIDEGHRSQYGLLASEMKNILNKASFFAFTGTPISKKDRDTYIEFSYPPEETYLDKYFVSDSLRDGFTVKIAYEPRLEKDVNLNKEILKPFMEIEEEEIPEDIRLSVTDSAKKKLTTIKVMLENENRITSISKDIAAHFKENLDGKFKAMVVTASRDACVIYKKELDKLLPINYSEIVMTYSKDSSQRIKNYENSIKARFGGLDVDDINKKIDKDFKESDHPKILIVTDMLLYGFNAPILQTMYLDKPLKEHRLLQAIARTNRPFMDSKEAGLIIDYVGILSNFDKAFEMYVDNQLFSKEEVENILVNIATLRAEFEDHIKKIFHLFPDIDTSKYDRYTIIDAIKTITADETQLNIFLNLFKGLRKKYEMLGSDKIKSELIERYKWILAVHTFYTIQLEERKTDNERRIEKYLEKYFGKTMKLIHKTTEIEKLKNDFPIIEFDENYIDNLEKSATDTREKVATLVFTLNRTVISEKHSNLLNETFIERVQDFMNRWKKKNKNIEEIYLEGISIVNEINEKRKRQKELHLTDIEYGIFIILEEKMNDLSLDEMSKSLIKELESNKLLFPGCFGQKTISKEIEREIRKQLRKEYFSSDKLNIREINEITEKILVVLKHNEDKFKKYE